MSLSPLVESNATMADSSEISPRDVVNALQTLTDDESKELFFQLEVPLNTLNDIAAEQKGNMRKIHYVQKWFDRNVEVGWEKIAAGLRLIGKLSLAEEIGPQLRVGRALTPQAVEDVTPDPVTPVEGVPESSELAPSSLTTVATTTPSSSSSTTDRVSQVKAEIKRLRHAFSSQIFEAQYEMSKYETSDPTFLDKFRFHLLGLPVALPAAHERFFRDSEDDFLKAENMRKIFAILIRYCNYRNPDVLKQVVIDFSNAELQQRMGEYCNSLERFEKATTVDVYLVAISAGEELSLAFTRMTEKINKPPSVCTLHEIRKMNKALTEKASLQSYSVYIESVSESSVLIVLRFPPSCVGWILAALTPDFMTTHLLTDVVVDEEQLAIEHTSQEELVYAYTQ